MIWISVISVALSLLLFTGGQSAVAETAAREMKGDYVILVHGMGRTSISMKRLQHYLARHGYQVINASYRSRQLSVNQLSEQYLNELIEKKAVDHDCKIHFVTHSLGGIIVRQYLANHRLENLGRVLMLSPPNHGSEIIDRLKANCLTRNFLGVAARELGTSADDLPAKLGPVHFECGVIAGNRSMNPLLSVLLSGPNDGKVTVASARVPGMQDFLVVRGTHTWLMCKPAVLDQTLGFLQSGHFNHSN